MGRKPTKWSPNKKQSFFKVLVGDFSKHLRIPQKFAMNHIPPSLGKCVLRGPIGKRSDVELERRKNGLFFHSIGWHSFVKDHLLQYGDFLVFHYDGKSKFKVKIYDITCCEIDVDEVEPMRRNGLPTATSQNEGGQFAPVKDEIVDDLETDTENADNRRRNTYMPGKPPTVEDGKETSTRSIIFKSKNSCFKADLNSRNSLYRVVIPIDLVVTNGLMSTKTVEIEDSTGRLWPAKLVRITHKEKTRGLAMSTGWENVVKPTILNLGTQLFLSLFRKQYCDSMFSEKVWEQEELYVSLVLDAPNIKN